MTKVNVFSLTAKLRFYYLHFEKSLPQIDRLSGRTDVHWCQINVNRAVRNRFYTSKTHLRGFQNLNFSLVRGGGLPYGKPQSVYVCVAANSIRLFDFPSLQKF
ncbi:MAG: hypothetical protein V7K68_25390 [Nostoc sp.]|uniref:hypothetical protein n=1 Tax=Nostoc sp. TaxID=1180 RepID=UPI002FFB1DFE